MLYQLLLFLVGAVLVGSFVFFAPFLAPEVRRRQPAGLGRFFTSRRGRSAYAMMAGGIGIGLSLGIAIGSTLPFILMAVSIAAFGFFMRSDETDEEREMRNRPARGRW